MDIFHVSQSWYVLFFAFLLSWLFLLVIRRNYRDLKEVKEQLYLAVAGMVVLSLMEIFAVSTDLWHYVPVDWPILLWPTYFVAILFGYQLLRLVEGHRF